MSENRKNISMDAMEEPEESQNGYSTNKFDTKNYLNVKLEKGENVKKIKIRCLPVDKDSTSPFQTIYQHSIKVPKELKEISPNTDYKSYICIKKTEDINHEKFGNKCPYCELYKEAYDKYVKANEEGNSKDAEYWKTIYKAARPSEGCIIRCIERGHEDEGTKFWKFGIRSDGLDPKHLIKSLYATRKQESIDEAMEEYGVKKPEELPDDFVPENILDLYNGKDLEVTISRVKDKSGNYTDKTAISITDYGKNKSISQDPEQIEAWITDEKRWQDVFSVKPYEYLSLIIDGEIPFYDKNAKKWVSKFKKTEETKEEKKTETESVDEKIREAEEKMKTISQEPTKVDENPEDLPF